MAKSAVPLGSAPVGPFAPVPLGSATAALSGSPPPRMLASAGPGFDAGFVTDEYIPDLGTNAATLKMYDKYFDGNDGARLKKLIKDNADAVDINPGLLAASMFAEDRLSSYTKRTGVVSGKAIGVDDYGNRRKAIESRIPAARKARITGSEDFINEKDRLIKVPIFEAADAVLAAAAYLKYGELMTRDACQEIGAKFDHLAVEYRFALTRFAMNAGPGAVRDAVKELILGIQWKLVRDTSAGKHPKYKRVEIDHILQFKPWKLEKGVEQFNAKKAVRRGATAHAAQSIHISQKIFGVNPLDGFPDALLYFR